MNQDDVYNYLICNGPHVVSDIAADLSGNADRDRLAVHRKIAQLRKWGMVRPYGTVHVNPGNDAVVWEAVADE